MSNITFKASNVHEGHYVYVNGINTGIVVNLFAYETVEEYKQKVDLAIEKFKIIK
jgi:hypothetical protein